jgi:hypothetical protein
MTMPSRVHEHLAIAIVPKTFCSSRETLASMYNIKCTTYFPANLDENYLQVDTLAIRYLSKHPPPS